MKNVPLVEKSPSPGNGISGSFSVCEDDDRSGPKCSSIWAWLGHFRAVLDLAGVEGERTHPLNCQFQQGGTGTLSLLVTISGTTASETISDLSTHQPVSQSKEELIIKQRYVNMIPTLSYGCV